MPGKGKFGIKQELRIAVIRIEGECPVFREGDCFYLKEGYQLSSEKPVCMHALASLLPFYNALRFVSAAELGLAGEASPERAFLQCPDPCSITGGGTVTFCLEKLVK